MTTNRLKKLEQSMLEARAHRLASELLSQLDVREAPVDPLAIATFEAPILKVRSDDFRDLFDGRLEYHRKQNAFLLFYNNKYDGTYPGRTRFSIAHELGHYYLPSHRAHLIGGGTAHSSRSEFRSVDTAMEREADAFAAGLLLPKALLYPRLGTQELDVAFLSVLADEFQTSMISTSMRAAQLTPFPCATMLLRRGRVIWRQVSGPLIEAGCYPRKGLHSVATREQWRRMVSGAPTEPAAEVPLSTWFDVYGEHIDESVIVTEHYVPMSKLGMLLVVVAADEDDVYAR